MILSRGAAYVFVHPLFINIEQDASILEPEVDERLQLCRVNLEYEQHSQDRNQQLYGNCGFDEPPPYLFAYPVWQPVNGEAYKHQGKRFGIGYKHLRNGAGTKPGENLAKHVEGGA